MRRDNLYDTDDAPVDPGTPPVPSSTPSVLTARTSTGPTTTCPRPAMGMAGTRFGRNVPLDAFPQPTREQCSSPTRARSAGR